MQAQGARVVTPEAVVLDVRTAGLGSRVFARAIDILVQIGVLLVIIAVAGALGTLGVVVILFAITGLVLLYPIVFETLWRGRTIGKAALGLRVVTRQGAPIRFRHALIRGLVGLGEVILLPVIGVLAMLISTSDQRLGDMLGGTIVIKERSAAQQSWPVVFYPPPGLESFVATLDVSSMTSAEYETVRSFLLRARDMAPLPRSNLAARLAGPFVTRWHQPVPPGMGPELWLACVAASYQQRHAPSTGAWTYPGGGAGSWPAPMATGPAGPWGPPPPQSAPQWGPPPPPSASQWGQPPPQSAQQPSAPQWGPPPLPAPPFTGQFPPPPPPRAVPAVQAPPPPPAAAPPPPAWGRPPGVAPPPPLASPPGVVPPSPPPPVVGYPPATAGPSVMATPLGSGEEPDSTPPPLFPAPRRSDGGFAPPD